MAVQQGKFVGFQTQGLWPTSLGLALARNSFLKALQVAAVVFSAASVGAASISEQAVSVAGVTTNDLVISQGQGSPTANVGLMGSSRVSAAGTVQQRYINPTAGALTPPASQTIFYMAFQVQ